MIIVIITLQKRNFCPIVFPLLAKDIANRYWAAISIMRRQKKLADKYSYVMIVTNALQKCNFYGKV